MLIAEDLLLLMYDDESGKPLVDSLRIDRVLAGAIMLELALSERIDVADRGEDVKKGRLVTRGRTPFGDDILDDGLAFLDSREGKKPQNVLDRLAKNLRPRLLERLAERGILQQEKGKVLGIFPTTRWPAADGHHEDGVRAELHAALVLGQEPTSRTAALIALLAAVDAVPKAVEPADRTAKKAMLARAKEISEGAWAAESVKKAVQASQAAIAASIAATSAAAGSAGS